MLAVRSAALREVRRLWLPLAAVLAIACTTKKSANLNPMSSFKVQIVCADGDGSTPCPKVSASGNTPLCSTLFEAQPPLVNLGAPTSPVSQSQNHYVVQVSALGPDGQPYAYTGTAGAYVMFEGTVTPTRQVQSDTPQPGGQQLPLALDNGSNWVQFPAATSAQAGMACFGVTIPPSFGQTALWVEDVPRTSYDPSVPHSISNPGKRIVTGTMALGASDPIYRPQPLIRDVQYTTDSEYTLSPLTNKHVEITNGTNGAPIVVTYVASNYFMVTDLGATGEDHAWGSLDVYSFSQPLGLQIGSTVINLDGAVSPFDGLTELGFPIWQVVNAAPDPTVPLPPPHVIQGSDIPQTLTRMKPWESGLVVAKGWTVVNVSEYPALLLSYQKYQEWVVVEPTPDGCAVGDPSVSCLVDPTSWQTTLNIVTNVTAPEFNPLNPNNVGKKFCNLQGILTHVVPAAGVQLWGITPRNACDLGQPVDPATPCETIPIPNCNPTFTPDAGP